MKFLYLKLCLTGGLLATSVGYTETITGDEAIALETQAFQYSPETQKSKPLPFDKDLYANKDYGVSGYSVIYQASSAAAVDQSADSAYGNEGCIYQPAGTSGLARYDIPLQIPDGHRILGMRYAYFDGTASSTRASIYSINNADGTYTDEHTVISSGDTGYNSEYVSLTGGLDINNGNFKYGIRFWSSEAGADQKMCALRIEVDSDPPAP